MSRHAIFALVMGLVLASAGAAQPAQLANPDQIHKGALIFSPEEEARYLERYKVSLSRTSNDQLYDILEDIPGAPDWKPLPAARPERRTISDSALQEALAYAAGNRSSALIVWRKGKIETAAYFGEASRGGLINSFSLAKPISALAMGRAIKLGKIQSLDQPVADFVTEWQADPVRSKILVRHLLDMRAGFLRQGGASGPDDIMARSFVHPRSDEIIIKEYPVTHQPGTRYEYNNATSAMVAVLIERATGRRYAEFIGTELLQKIGAPGGQAWLNRKGGVANSGCCMMLPATTYLRLAILMMRDGVWNGEPLLPEGFVAEMKTPTLQNPHYGMGVYVAGQYTPRRGWANADIPIPKILHSEPYLAGDLYLFDGNMNQVVYMVPSQDLVILRTGASPPRTPEREWDNSYLPNIIMRGIIRDAGRSLPQPK